MNLKEIENKIFEIVNFIKSSDTYKNYLKAESLLQEDKETITLINDIKKYQKELVKNPNKKKEYELKIKKNLDSLNENPVYLEHKYFQDEINNQLTILENKINKYFEDVFN